MVDLGPCGTSTSAVWEEAIKNAAGGRLVAYTDGSRDDDGRVGGRWYADGNRAGSIVVGNVVTIWDREVVGIGQALRMAPGVGTLVMTDLIASLLAIGRSASSGRGCTRELVEVVDEVGRRSQLGLNTQFGWVKAHVGVVGNDHEDQIAKAGGWQTLLPQMMKGAVRWRCKAIRRKDGVVSGLGTGQVVRWHRRAVLRYTQLRVGKGDVGEWRRVLGAQVTLC